MIMGYVILPVRPLDHPYRTLIITFAIWKLFLLLVAIASPGDGYDTSTTLLQQSSGAVSSNGSFLKRLLLIIANRLTRWDAIHFTGIAKHGYVFEQQWAFGWGINYPMTFGTYVIRRLFDVEHSLPLESLVGIVIAHTFHGLSVTALYELTRELTSGMQSRKLALLAASLHVFSPAGVFLSAPYGESSFAAFNFLGYLLYVRGARHTDKRLSHEFQTIAAGLVLGCATMIRSNGLLNGILFLEEAVLAVISLPSRTWSPVRRLISAGIAGVFVALGYAVPQLAAYYEFCSGLKSSHTRPWCNSRHPSIFSFVQSHYWNVGFLRYWTLSNLPLFMLATPMLTVMIVSAYRTIMVDTSTAKSIKQPLTRNNVEVVVNDGERNLQLRRSLAIPQLILAVLALFNFHVQIITRISSGYPVWYIWLAGRVIQRSSKRKGEKQAISAGVFDALGLVRLLSMYAIVQAGLFASFLPPA